MKAVRRPSGNVQRRPLPEGRGGAGGEEGRGPGTEVPGEVMCAWVTNQESSSAANRDQTKPLRKRGAGPDCLEQPRLLPIRRRFGRRPHTCKGTTESAVVTGETVIPKPWRAKALE